MKKKLAFSLVEILVAIITFGIITAALAPTMTQRIKSSKVAVNPVTVSESCATKINPDCTLCFKDKCLACNKTCNANEFKNIQECVCSACTTYNANCIECNSSKCTRCASGYGKSSSGECTKCLVGYYSDGDDICKPAPIGSYIPADGASTYTLCDAGTYQDEEGKGSCKSCDAGTYQDEAGKSSCKTCEIDHACSGGNNRTQCALNQGAEAGSSTCSSCGAGCLDCQIPSVCLLCASGYYASGNTCVICPEGSICDGSTNQAQCSAGYFAAQGSTSCTPCAAGSYSSSAGSGACVKCVAGTYSQGLGSTDCTNCPAGSYSPSEGSTSCTKCANDSYSQAGQSTCSKCADKWEHCLECDASECKKCEDGYNLEEGECKEESCGDYSKKFTYGGKDYCITKYNIGDVTIPMPSGSASMAYQGTANNQCTSDKCCWVGQTSDTCTSSYSYYSPCTRTVCTYSAAASICNNLTLEDSSDWKLPNINMLLSLNLAEYSINKGTDGLMLCDLNAGYTSPQCSSGVCLGSSDGYCYANQIWSSSIHSTSGYPISAKVENAAWTDSDRLSRNALSVRCIREIKK